MNGIDLMVFILSRGRGEELVRLAAEENIGFHITLHGRGTADSQILNLLGIGDSEKDILLISVESERSSQLMQSFCDKLKLDAPGGGIAFMIPFSAISSQLHSGELFAGTLPRREAAAENKNERKRKGLFSKK